jgi:nicotinate-nucleotide--dimethylbenzimidazole phosphoribosyltransferase
MAHLDAIDAVLFDVGNTLVTQNNPGLPFSELKVEILPGVRELLETLFERKKLALVSNSKQLTAEEIMQKLSEVDLAKYFDVCISSLDVGFEKPSPIPLSIALERLGVQAKRALYVGDIDTDKEAAHAAGMKFMFTGQNINKAFENYISHPDSAWDRAKNCTIELSLEKEKQVLDGFNALVKPQGSLGKLEKYTAQISKISGASPVIDPCAVAVFVADHGIAKDDSVTPWPQSITSLMADLIIDGEAGISSLAANSNIYIEVVNVGTTTNPKSEFIKNYHVAAGTKDFRNEAAMTTEQLFLALDAGAQTAERLVAGGSRSLCTGEVGIGNTTASAILIGSICQASAEEITGYGSGIPQEIFANKVRIVNEALANTKGNDPVEILASHGGLEIAALVGFIIRGATLSVPIILDGVITLAAACIAVQIRPEVGGALIAGHCSTEPASQVAIKYLGLDPVLDLNLRLGEGTGAALSIPILRAGCVAYEKMGKLTNYI